MLPLMPIRFRKSVKIGGGLRLNVGKTGIGMSLGVPGARYSINSSGRETRSIGLPGTGVGFVSTTSSGSRRAARSRTAHPQTVSGAAAAGALAKPGFFAGGAEKAYYRGLVAYLSGDSPRAVDEFEAVVAQDPAATSAHLFAAISAGATNVPDEAQIAHLEAVVRSDAPFPDRLMAKFLPPDRTQLAITVSITDAVTASVPVSPIGAALVLAEAYQEAGRLDEAIGIVQQLHATNPAAVAIRLSLADLLLADGDHEGVIELTQDVTNDDDLSVALLHLRGAAFVGQGHPAAAIDVFRAALAKTANRSPELLMDVRYDRALAYEAIGQKAKARADFERLYAADPSYRDVRDRLASS
jgi:tetratricopeptide (TPR) repeat protein